MAEQSALVRELALARPPSLSALELTAVQVEAQLLAFEREERGEQGSEEHSQPSAASSSPSAAAAARGESREERVQRLMAEALAGVRRPEARQGVRRPDAAVAEQPLRRRSPSPPRFAERRSVSASPARRRPPQARARAVAGSAWGAR